MSDLEPSGLPFHSLDLILLFSAEKGGESMEARWGSKVQI